LTQKAPSKVLDKRETVPKALNGKGCKRGKVEIPYSWQSVRVGEVKDGNRKTMAKNMVQKRKKKIQDQTPAMKNRTTKGMLTQVWSWKGGGGGEDLDPCWCF